MTCPLSSNRAILMVLALTGLPACRHENASTRNMSGARGPDWNPRRLLSDAEVNAAVLEMLAKDPGVDSTNLEAKTTRGIVELIGKVSNLLTKRRAVRVAESVRGVRSVSDRTELRLAPREDSELTRDIKRALAGGAIADATGISPRTKLGTVTLSGSVKSHQERMMAERLAEGVLGVRAVNNALTVTPSTWRSDAAISTDVSSRLGWDALINDGLIDVTVHDGQVTLSGRVASAAERRRANVDAWVLGAGSVNVDALSVDFTAREADLKKHKVVARSDGAIAAAIEDAAAYEPRVNAADLRVSVNNGQAFLRGRVPNLKGRLAAEDVARHTAGVLGVHDELEVRPMQLPSDSALASSVENALRGDPYTSAYPIEVTAKAGKVSLTGTVDSPFERAQATDLASGFEGAMFIDNRLSVKENDRVYVYSAYFFPYSPYWESWYSAASATTRSDTQIAQDIQEELAWSPFVDAARVNVDVSHGGAKLTGQVDSQSERIAATEDAYAAGALTVDNRVTLSNGR